MALSTSYSLTFAGIPLCLDEAARTPCASGSPLPQESVLDYLNRVIPFRQLQDFQHAQSDPSRNHAGVARELQARHEPGATDVRIGEWYYPNGAAKFSVFRGLATSSQAKAMLAGAGKTPAPFVMKATPDSPYVTGKDYELLSQMTMLPPRPLAEHGGAYDGLYLITLVDERYFWQYEPVTLQPTQNTTWEQLITALQIALGVSLTHSAVEEEYGRPEPDSQLWGVYDDAALLLDAVAYNVGRTVVRNLDGTYNLYTPAESATIARTNRAGKVTRVAGGDLFTSGTGLRVGNLNPARDVIVPATVVVTFPKYVLEVPAPHYYNPRGQNTRWQEDQFGDAYALTVPISSGGVFASGLTGYGQLTLQDNCKAYFDSEDKAAPPCLSGPTNLSGLRALGMRLAGDYYGGQAGSALDEVYPGTLDWAMEGFDDVVWTYSAVARGAYTRVMRSEWTAFVRSFQHAVPPASGLATVPAGVGGPATCLAVDDLSSMSGGALAATLLSGGQQVRVRPPEGFPASRRWKGQINGQETALFERVILDPKTGDGVADVVRRGIDGTLQQKHFSGEAVTYVVPQVSYGVNHVTFGAGLTAEPTDFTSGGLYGVRVNAGGTGDVTYQNNTFNYYNVTFNTFTNFTLNITDVFFITGGDLVVFSSYVQCGWTYWCWVNYAVITSVIVDLDLAGLPNLDGHGRIVIRLTSTADFALQSMVPVPDDSGENAGQLIALVNTGTGIMTVLHAGGGTDQFLLEADQNQVVEPEGCVLCWHDPDTLCWRTFRQPELSATIAAADFALAAPYALTSTYASTTLVFTAPATGNYLIYCNAQATIQDGAITGARPQIRVQNTTAGPILYDTRDLTSVQVVGQTITGCGGVQFVTNLTAGDVVELYARYSAGIATIGSIDQARLGYLSLGAGP